ncbi:penicillin acylase family protein [Salsuginibacillus kocurii]|uniref:penicillin acylase family protein n=1 Tax=Salsuginibacillus kocurii TaxID=427078 RepID=UPI00047577E9|nr:penicillin acylase family protein [Salsuginibacillus kocurii]
MQPELPGKTSQKSRVKKWVLISLLLLLALGIAAGVWAYMQVNNSQPVTKGEVPIERIEEPVSIYRDDHGVPHIEAENETDLYFAQGFVTAQDRMFQMDMSRRQASGTLSEVIGEEALEADKYFRTFGLRRAAEDSLEGYGDEAMTKMQAYADGVNAYIERAAREGNLPVEFSIISYAPDPWTPLDTLTIGKFMAYDLSGRWEGQAFRHWLSHSLPEDKALDLFPTYPKEGPVILEAAKEYPVDIAAQFSGVGEYLPNPENGSNNWVISGERTKSGEPLLADDPHLALNTPSIWYETHLSSPDINVTGVTFGGIPGIVVGHNEHVAWGVTNVNPDVQDLYIERRNPEDPYQFEYEGSYEEATVIEEEIKVAGQDEPETHEIIITRHGPLISEFAYPEDMEEEAPDTALSMKWTAHDPTTEMEAFYQMNRAENWEDFETALRSFQAPAQNFVFADTEGTIAYRANGKIPIRSKGEGLVPKPGWSGEYTWDDYIPWEDLPTIINPESGMISTANNQIAGEEYPHHLTHTWAQPFRHQRILDELKDEEKLTIEDMKNLQVDVKNLQAEELLPVLIEKLEGAELSETEEKSRIILEEWDYYDKAEQAAPLIFHLWLLEVGDVLFEDDIPEEVMDLFSGQAGIVDELVRAAAAGEEGAWMEAGGGFSTVALTSFERAVDRGSELQGNDPESWEWGAFHQAVFEHPLAAIWPLNHFFNPSSVPAHGSSVTVKAAGFDEETGEVNHGAGWRGIMDLSDLSESKHLVAPGQSGHRLSEWYTDQASDWIEGNYHTTSMDPDEYRNTENTLQLIPFSPGG